MRVNLEDQLTHLIQKQKTPWLPYAVLATISALTLTGFAYLYQKGWGIKINLNKLSEAITANGSTEKQKASLLNRPPPASQASVINHKTDASGSDVYIAPPGKAPITWEVQLAKFNSIYVRHPSCNPHNLQWTQMDCSNYKGRAMKRFQEEWSKNSYWNGQQIISNKTADARVNAELYE